MGNERPPSESGGTVVSRPTAIEMTRLASLFDCLDDASSWSEEECAEILDAFLRSPLSATLDRWRKLTPELRNAIESHGLAVALDVFASKGPPVAVLDAIKGMAKAQDSAAEPEFPPPVARTIYYAAILHARATAGAAISSLPGEEIERGARLCVERRWVVPALQHVFSTGRGEDEPRRGG